MDSPGEGPVTDTGPMTDDVEDVPVRGAIRLGQFLKLANLAQDGARARDLVRGGDVTVNGSVETRRGHALSGGDVVRVDLNKRTANVKLTPEEIEQRKKEMGEYREKKMPKSHTPWQEIFRNETGELSEGMVLNRAVKYQRIAQTNPVGRQNH